jgi:hypothetical protein
VKERKKVDDCGTATKASSELALARSLEYQIVACRLGKAYVYLKYGQKHDLNQSWTKSPTCPGLSLAEERIAGW